MFKRVKIEMQRMFVVKDPPGVWLHYYAVISLNIFEEFRSFSKYEYSWSGTVVGLGFWQ